uniref:Uncharacterized protein n=1 Tax=Ananas comosus var. bracteatus TaxID=296719 RepID=A0A6V7P4M5_ANACO|nr:unnamed protein product [Ananas comosus var. bracteatus]
MRVVLSTKHTHAWPEHEPGRAGRVAMHAVQAPELGWGREAQRERKNEWARKLGRGREIERKRVIVADIGPSTRSKILLREAREEIKRLQMMILKAESCLKWHEARWPESQLRPMGIVFGKKTLVSGVLCLFIAPSVAYSGRSRGALGPLHGAIFVV